MGEKRTVARGGEMGYAPKTNKNAPAASVLKRPGAGTKERNSLMRPKRYTAALAVCLSAGIGASQAGAIQTAATAEFVTATAKPKVVSFAPLPVQAGQHLEVSVRAGGRQIVGPSSTGVFCRGVVQTNQLRVRVELCNQASPSVVVRSFAGPTPVRVVLSVVGTPTASGTTSAPCGLGPNEEGKIETPPCPEPKTVG